jgi:hypothetical protein
MKFAQIRYQYDVMGHALKALPELQEVRKAQEEEEMTVYEQNKRLNDLRRRMFGEVIPDLLPENEEEEAHPEIIVRRFQEGQRRQQEQFAREHRERQRKQAAEKARKEEEDFTEGNEGGEEDEETGEGTFTEATPTKGPRGGCGGNGEKEDMAEEPQPEAENVLVDEPRKLSAEERQREYEELMRRARGRGR